MLVDEIIDILGDDTNNLNSALLKTKILLHQIGKKELVEWVNYELNGYPSKVVVPSYRVVPASVRGYVESLLWKIESAQLPTMHLPDSIKKSIETHTLREPLDVLEQYAKIKEGFIQREIPPEMNGLFQEKLNKEAHIQRVWCQTSPEHIRGAVTQVRSRLLDFLLELKDGLGEENSKDARSMKEKAAQIDAQGMLSHAVFGSNNTFLFGHGNHQTATNHYAVSSLSDLAHEMRKLGLLDEDIEALTSSIEKDEKMGGKASLDGETGTWFNNILKKAAAGSAKVGVGVVTGTISKLLVDYINK